MTFEFEQSTSNLAAVSEAKSPEELINGSGDVFEIPEAESIDQPSESIDKGQDYSETVEKPLQELLDIDSLSEEEFARYGEAVDEWQIAMLQAEADFEEEIINLKESQNQAAIEMKLAESDHKAAKKLHKEILSKLMERKNAGPEYPEKPLPKDFKAKPPAEDHTERDRDLLPGEGSFADRDHEEEEEDTSWRLIPTSEVIQGIERMGEKKFDLICHEFPTLGDLQDARAEASKQFKHFSEKLPKGCGKNLADSIEDRILEAVAKKR